MVIVALVGALAVILWPESAYAWGPITHIVHGSSILANLTSLPGSLQTLLAAYPDNYLYGCIGADIIQAKAYTRDVATHCHSWPIAWRIVASADDDSERAFAWGYMTHLAADIVSHNHFVPSNLLRSFDKRTLGHAYWEARADALQDDQYWHRARRVLRQDFADCDRLVEEVVDYTLFSFKTNKKIFDSLMSLSKLEQWKSLVARVNNRSRFEMQRTTVDEYNQICIASASDLLTHGTDSYTQYQDATGREVLARTSRLRKRLRALKRSGLLPAGTEVDLVAATIPALAELVTVAPQAALVHDRS